MTRLNITVAAFVIFVSCGYGKGIEDKQEIKKTLRFLGTTGPRRIVVDNIKGSIDVRGYDGDSVELIAHRTNYGESDDKIAEAKQEVTLDMREEKDRILVYVNAPWRCSEGINERGWKYYGYDVAFDFELKVPRKTDFFVKTVNDGDISVRGLEGDFEVGNVNGGVDMQDIAGSGMACTVNGPVNVVFSKNPLHDCRFKTVNGKVDVEFRDGFSADLSFETFNGSVYTDFDVQSVPRKPRAVESHGTRKVYLNDKSFAVRIGQGGPNLSFDTLNGNIHILKREE